MHESTLVLLVISALVPCFGLGGGEFWLALPPNYQVKESYFLVTTDENDDVNFTVQVGRNGVELPYVAVKGVVTKVTINERYVIKASNIQNMGNDLAILIKAYPCYRNLIVYGFVEGRYTTDAFLALPKLGFGHRNTNGYEYYAVSVPDHDIDRLDRYTFYGYLVIVASEGNTSIMVSPSVETFTFYNTNFSILPGETFRKVIQQGDVITFRAPVGDLTGSAVVSDKPITVLSGHECAFIPSNKDACDMLVEQIPPTASWGFKFVLTPLGDRLASGFKFIAHKNSTFLTLVCSYRNASANNITHILLNAAQHDFRIIPSKFWCYVTANVSILVLQFGLGSQYYDDEKGDPFMMIVPSFSQLDNNYTLMVHQKLSVNDKAFVPTINVYIPENDFNLGSLRLNEMYQNLSFFPIKDSQGAVVARGAHIDPSLYSHNLNQPFFVSLTGRNTKFGITYYASRRESSYGLPGGLNLKGDSFCDVDECKEDLHNCSQRCINTVSGFTCSCYKGYYLGSDDTLCLMFSLENIYDLINQLSNITEDNAESSLNIVTMLYPFMLESLQLAVSDNATLPFKLYEAYGLLYKTVVNVRRQTADFNVLLSSEKDGELLTGFVDIAGVLLSPEAIVKLENKTNAAVSSVSTVVASVETLAIIVASSVTRSNGTKTYTSGDIRLEATRVPTFSNASFLIDENVTVEFISDSIKTDEKSSNVLTTVSLGKIGNALSQDDEVGANVVSIQIYPEISSLASDLGELPDNTFPVQIRFTDVESNFSLPVQCVFYEYMPDGTPVGWSSRGMRTLRRNSTVYCSSNHLTSFSVLVNVGGVKFDSITELALRYFSYIGCALSIICLLLTIAALLCFRWKGQKNPLNFIHINLTVVLLVALIIFVGGSWYARTIKILCSVLAGLLHYFFLAVFSWMLCEGVMLYLMVVKVFSQLSKKWWFFLLLGYGLPIPAIIVGAAVRYEQYGSEEFGCFLSPEYGTIWAFAAPALGIIVVLEEIHLSDKYLCNGRSFANVNSVFLVMALVQLYKSQKSTVARTTKNIETVKATVKAAILLLPIMGLTWVFGFISLDYGVDALRTLTLIFNIIFIVLNSLQGVFIFVFYVLRNDKMKPLWVKCCPRILKKKLPGTSTKSSGVKSTIEMGTFSAPKSYYEINNTATDNHLADGTKDGISITESNMEGVNTSIGMVYKEIQEVEFTFQDDNTSVADFTFALKEVVISSSLAHKI